MHRISVGEGEGTVWWASGDVGRAETRGGCFMNAVSADTTSVVDLGCSLPFAAVSSHQADEFQGRAIGDAR